MVLTATRTKEDTMTYEPEQTEPGDPGMTVAERDEYENELVATGATLMVLRSQGQGLRVKQVTGPRGRAANQIDVQFPFMGSPYRLTVTRIDEPF